VWVIYPAAVFKYLLLLFSMNFFSCKQQNIFLIEYICVVLITENFSCRCPPTLGVTQHFHVILFTASLDLVIITLDR
jgi:hypothetical protein